MIDPEDEILYYGIKNNKYHFVILTNDVNEKSLEPKQFNYAVVTYAHKSLEKMILSYSYYGTDMKVLGRYKRKMFVK